MDECIHGLGPVAACTLCNGRDARESAEDNWRTFSAKYESTCGGCELPIHAGQLIDWRPGSTTYHEGCRP